MANEESSFGFLNPFLKDFAAVVASNPLESLVCFIIIFASWPLYLLLLNVAVVAAAGIFGLVIAEMVPIADAANDVASKIILILAGSLLGLFLFQKFKKLAIFILISAFSIFLLTGYPLTAEVDYSILKFDLVPYLRNHAEMIDVALALLAGILSAVFERVLVVALTSAAGAWMFYGLSGNKTQLIVLFFGGVIVQFVLSSFFKPTYTGKRDRRKPSEPSTGMRKTVK